jgi:hypothetical protein
LSVTSKQSHAPVWWIQIVEAMHSLILCYRYGFVLDVKPQSIEHAHVYVRNPNQGKLGDDVTAPSNAHHLELRQQ